MNKLLLEVNEETRQFDYDFVFHAGQAANYLNWLFSDSKSYSVFLRSLSCFQDGFDKSWFMDKIPVGSLNFMFEYFGLFGLCVPCSLTSRFCLSLGDGLENFFLRDVLVCSRGWLLDNKDKLSGWFIKSFYDVKGFSSFLRDVYFPYLKDDVYFLTKVVYDVVSEWRVFVFNGKIVGVVPYYFSFSDIKTKYLSSLDILYAKEIVDWCSKSGFNCPPAYTVDFLVDSKGNSFLLELHDFYSIGLYGFQDYSMLLKMFVSWFMWFKSNNNILCHYELNKYFINSKCDLFKF